MQHQLLELFKVPSIGCCLPCYPLHKVQASLLSHSDSLQVYTLAMQARVVERPHCCFHLLQTKHGACVRQRVTLTVKMSLSIHD